MMPPHCTETSLDHDGRLRSCSLSAGHEGDHMGWDCQTWEPPGAVLQRLQRTWGTTHRIAWTGSMWLATARDRRARWRSHVEPTPQQLEASLHRHTAHPPTGIQSIASSVRSGRVCPDGGTVP